MEERSLNTKLSHYYCKFVHPDQRRAMANIYHKRNFFCDRHCAAGHIVLNIGRKGDRAALSGC